MRRLLPLLAALLGLAACSNRERLNPLDPHNPVTGGAPVGFSAVADNGSVHVSWQAVSGPGVTAYRLTRRVGANPMFELLADLPTTVSSYSDVGLSNGVDHTYRLQYVLESGDLGRSVEEVATPGAVVPWVADFTARALLRLSPDGRHIAERITGGLVSPSDIAIDAATGQIWVCDTFAGRFLRFSSGSPAPDEYGAMSEPAATAVDASNGRAWVCDDVLGWVQAFDPLNPVIPVADVRGLAQPRSVAVDPRDHSAWVCERSGDRVRHIGPIGGVLGSGRVVEPARVAVDSLTENVWVTSFTQGRVTVLSPAGVAIDSILGLAGPIGIAIDSHAGLVWVADALGSRILVYDRAGSGRLHIDNLPQVREIGLDPVRGEAWATLPQVGQVARIRYDGTVLGRLGGMVQPYDVAVMARP